MSYIILITGAGTGMGRLAARALADAGHTVYATMRDPNGRNSANAAVAKVIEQSGRLDVVIHNAAHLYHGVTEAFTPEQVLAAYDTNAVGALRVNRAALPVLRRQGSGLLLWIGSGTSMVVPPFLAPYTAAKAAMDSLAESVSVEVARYGIETSIVMPGAFTQGTEHFPNAARAADDDVAAEYDKIADAIANNGAATEALFAPGVVQDVQAVADENVRIVGLPHGERPYRASVDFSDFGDVPVSAVSMAQRERLLKRFALGDVLKPTKPVATA